LQVSGENLKKKIKPSLFPGDVKNIPMVKKKNEETELPGERTHKKHVHALYLEPGTWKESFTALQYRVMIAEALNYCTCYEGMIICGYLITRRSVSLVLKMDEPEINRTLDVFYDRLKKEIKKLRDPGRIAEWNEDHENRVEAEQVFISLFKRHPLIDERLIKLLTGRPFELPYYDPQLARLKDIISHERFCSVLDYAGGESPVIVQLLFKDREISEDKIFI
jgi:hypothetical protein